MVVSLSMRPQSMKTEGCWMSLSWRRAVCFFGFSVLINKLLWESDAASSAEAAALELPSSSSSSFAIAAESWKRLFRTWVWSSPFGIWSGATLCCIVKLCSSKRFIALLCWKLLAGKPSFWHWQWPTVRYLPHYLLHASKPDEQCMDSWKGDWYYASRHCSSSIGMCEL